MALIKVSPEMQTVPFRKNVIINGGMDIWQRGTSFVGVTTVEYMADRFNIILGNSGTWDITRSSNVPTVAEAGVKFNYSWRADCTTADGTIDPTDTFYFEQKVEGYNYKHLYQQDQTISFWVKTNKTGVYCVTLGSTDRTYVSETTVNAADTWEKKTVTITTAPSAGTWNFTNGIGLFIEIVLVNGSNRVTTTTDAWQSGFFASTSNQVNLADSTSNYIQITGVQLEKGTVATEFEYRPIGEELALCQRYYEKSFKMDVTPADNVVSNVSAGSAFGTLVLRSNREMFVVEKRDLPSIIYYNGAAFAGTSGLWNVFNSGWATSTAHSTQNISEKGFQVDISRTGLTNNNSYLLDGGWTASSEL